MKTKHTNKEVLVNGLKKLAIALLYMFLGPILLHIAFSNQEKPLYIPILIVGLLICFFAIYMAFRGLKTIIDSMFNSN
ncbi:hypothetical protein C1T31_11325 [Hanstruepera neustonica]|uniref:Uncharacterized protein n=1 Tax=Hanstruepera neustonica TaxID=1445657 RepID=A0A2K1DXG0_9FLAO|nr:DUF6095 family protein [Hanstruepera neustonica]PNQ72724.1 hypothetical protein C1T31_11325 [Hanstruepera neustonica]